MANCQHSRQKNVDGIWRCRLCGVPVKSEPTDPKDYRSIRFGGLEAFKQFRALGKSEQRMTEENIKAFRKRKGYDPVRENERWI